MYVSAQRREELNVVHPELENAAHFSPDSRNAFVDDCGCLRSMRSTLRSITPTDDGQIVELAIEANVHACAEHGHEDIERQECRHEVQVLVPEAGGGLLFFLIGLVVGAIGVGIAWWW